MQVRLRFSRAFLTLFTSWSKLVIPEQRLFSNYIHLPMPEDHFGESVAARYDDSADEMFDAVVIDGTVAFLADLAGAIAQARAAIMPDPRQVALKRAIAEIRERAVGAAADAAAAE